MKSNIDFVIPWVDCNDLEWIKEYNKYQPDNEIMNKFERYRDWDNLEYVFRAFEYFTPWVNKIYFITYGHVPKWLNINHPKLVIVRHDDYMDKKYLPTFSSHPIELNINKIKGLNEKFVYFNDDLFILKKMNPSDFFQNDLPMDSAISNIMHSGIIAHIIVNNISTLNNNFNRFKGDDYKKINIIKKNFFKWFNFKYKFHSLKTLLLIYWPSFTGFLNYHHPQPFLKSTFDEIWSKEEKLLNQVSQNKFRTSQDVNQYLFRYWHLVQGKFSPDSYSNMYEKRKHIEVRTKKDVFKVATEISSKKFQMYCINDAMSKGKYTKNEITKNDFEESKILIQKALNSVLPNKSSFEV